jgi:non-ribosomal peptide synthetase component F
MRSLAADQKRSFFAVVLAGLAILLARVSRQSRFVLAIPFADNQLLANRVSSGTA